MSLLIATPVILPPREEIVATWDHRPHLLVVNGERSRWDALDEQFVYKYPVMDRNLGVAASWNVAFTWAQQHDLGYVALISQSLSLRDGTAGLARAVDEHADWRGLLTHHAFHCIVISVALWERVGPFDERYYPAYFEDADWLHRCTLMGFHTPDNPIPKLDVVGVCDTAAAYKAGVMTAEDYSANGRRYHAKWGGFPGHETTALENIR